MTTGYRLIALNAKNGAMVPSFGESGVVDLKKGAMFGKGQQIELETGEIGLHSTPTVVGNTVLIGSSFKEGMTVATHNNTKGLVRAFDARTGKLLWTFNTIPRPGEFGNDTWENQSWDRTATPASGRRSPWTQKPASSTCRSKLRPPTNTAATGRATASSATDRVRRPQDRRAQVALPDRPSPDLGLRHLVGADL